MANYFHESVKIDAMTSIEVSSRGTHTYIGAYSVIDAFVKIKHVGGSGNIEIGEHVIINSGTVLYSGNGIKIGNSVLIGPNCNIVPVNHSYFSTEVEIRQQGFSPSKGGITIENDVWLGANVTIVDGAYIKKGSIIGSNSLVIGIIDEYSINFGIPAKKISNRN